VVPQRRLGHRQDIACRDGDKHDDGRIHITSVAPLDQVRPGWVVCATGAGASSVDYTDVYDSVARRGLHGRAPGAAW
jgi:hypothetical protein